MLKEGRIFSAGNDRYYANQEAQNAADKDLSRCVWVGYGQQMLHLVQFLVDVDEPALLQTDTVQEYVRIQVRPPFCSS